MLTGFYSECNTVLGRGQAFFSMRSTVMSQGQIGRILDILGRCDKNYPTVLHFLRICCPYLKRSIQKVRDIPRFCLILHLCTAVGEYRPTMELNSAVLAPELLSQPSV